MRPIVLWVGLLCTLLPFTSTAQTAESYGDHILRSPSLVSMVSKANQRTGSISIQGTYRVIATNTWEDTATGNEYREYVVILNHKTLTVTEEYPGLDQDIPQKITAGYKIEQGPDGIPYARLVRIKTSQPPNL